jgi:hypothetical protein
MDSFDEELDLGDSNPESQNKLALLYKSKFLKAMKL